MKVIEKLSSRSIFLRQKKPLRVFDPREIFRYRLNLRSKMEFVGQEKIPVLTIENFYANPMLVRNFFLSTPAAIWKRSASSRNFKDYYDCRHDIHMPYGFEAVNDLLENVVRKHFGFKVSFPSSALSNVFLLNKKQPTGTSAFPHHDILGLKVTQPVNILVYLNTREESRGGTAFFRHLETGRECVPLEPKKFKEFDRKYIEKPGEKEDGTTYWCHYQRKWERFHLVPMRFNRMVIFPSKVFHGAWHEPGWFKEYPRINQVYFAQGLLKGGKK